MTGKPSAARRARIAALLAAGIWSLLASAQIATAAPFLIVGIDRKASWDSVTGRPTYGAPGRDSVVVIDLTKPQAPKLVATLPLENSVTGPPTNLAITPDEATAIIANSVTNTARKDGGFEQVPTSELFVVDLKAKPPRLVETLAVGKQPSGLGINPAGTLALVAYRGETALGLFRIERGRLRDLGRVEVGGAPSHVVFTPDGRRALAVKQDANKVALLDVAGETVRFARELPTGSGPYNVDVTPDGRLAATSDRGALTVIDLTATPPQVTQSVKVEQGSEGLAISPGGDIAVSVALRGSNAPPTSSAYHARGAMVVLRIDGGKLTPIKTIELGRVPEGVDFAPDGRHLYVANFYDNDIWIFRIAGAEVIDTGRRLKLPGHPASARTSPVKPLLAERTR